MLSPYEFYRDENVRKRILEYCSDAVYLVGYGERELSSEKFKSVQKSELNWILDNELDVFRSNWDNSSTLAVFDIEYFNLDFHAEIFLKPYETYLKLEPVYKTLLKIFSKYGIEPLVLMTGQGYHFSMKVPYSSPVHKKLETMSKICNSVEGKYNTISGRRKQKVPINHGIAFETTGRLIEYIGHQLVTELKNQNTIPLVFTDVAVGTGIKGREAISLDISMYGDPLFMRDIRCAFSVYQKHKVKKWLYGDHISRNVPYMIAIPRKKEDKLKDMIQIRTNYENSAKLASLVNTSIPDASSGFNSIIAEYSSSKFCNFHRDFDNVASHEPQQWQGTYDMFDLRSLPPCIRKPLEQPNDLLLIPTNIQSVVRVLMKMGWHPKHIAGLLRSKYERDYKWGGTWMKYDAQSRGNFYVRMFAGLIADGLDGEIDLNCISHRQKDYCVKPSGCGFNLTNYKLP